MGMLVFVYGSWKNRNVINATTCNEIVLAQPRVSNSSPFNAKSSESQDVHEAHQAPSRAQPA